MATPGVFLATRNPTVPSACRVFGLTVPSTPATTQQLRAHLLRTWSLHVRVFDNEESANLWATGVLDGATAAGAIASAAVSSSHLTRGTPRGDVPRQGVVLRSFFDGAETIVDLGDPQSASAFFLALGECTSAGGVRVEGMLLDDSPSTFAAAPCPPHKRRRLALVAGGSAEGRLPDGGTGRAGDHERRRVAWAYQGSSLGGRASFAGRADHLAVANRPAQVKFPSSVGGDLRRVLHLVNGGSNVFLTGPPGCGKTHIVNEAVVLMRDAGLVVSVCASTGVAATLVRGTTVHSWAGFCNGEADVVSPLETVIKTVIPFAAKARMCAAMVLVIDEVGTLSSAFMARLDEVLRIVRRRSSPFGGLTVLASGDFLQLSPVQGSYAFLSDTWRDAFGYRAVILKTHWRHVKDAEMLNLLLRVRKGRHTAADMALLATRRTAVAPPGVMCLFCHTADASHKNEEELLRLPGESVIFKAVDKVQAKYLSLPQASALLNAAVKLQETLTLRVGAAVAVPTGCLEGQGVPCGSRGVVTCFRAVGERRYPRVRFALPSGKHKTIDVILATQHAVALDGMSRAATRSQVPLVLAWASTIHAAQGWTLQEAAVDLTSAFAAGQALSGLSRTPTLERLHIIGFDEDRIFVDDTALAFHESLVDY